MRSYEITQNKEEVCGVVLVLFFDGEEVSRKVHYPTWYGNYTSDEQALEFAYADARNEGERWGSKPEPQKIPSLQIQPCQERVGV